MDILFSETELGNGNMAGTLCFEKSNEEKMRFLSSILLHKFDLPSFMEQWDNVCTKLTLSIEGKEKANLS